MRARVARPVHQRRDDRGLYQARPPGHWGHRTRRNSSFRPAGAMAIALSGRWRNGLRRLRPRRPRGRCVSRRPRRRRTTPLGNQTPPDCQGRTPWPRALERCHPRLAHPLPPGLPLPPRSRTCPAASANWSRCSGVPWPRPRRSGARGAGCAPQPDAYPVHPGPGGGPPLWRDDPPRGWHAPAGPLWRPGGPGGSRPARPVGRVGAAPAVGGVPAWGPGCGAADSVPGAAHGPDGSWAGSGTLRGPPPSSGTSP